VCIEYWDYVSYIVWCIYSNTMYNHGTGIIPLYYGTARDIRVGHSILDIAIMVNTKNVLYGQYYSDNTVHYTVKSLYNVQCSHFIVHCTVQYLYCVLYTVQYSICTVYCTVQSLYCIVYSTVFVLYSAQYNHCIVHNTVQ